MRSCPAVGAPALVTGALAALVAIAPSASAQPAGAGSGASTQGGSATICSARELSRTPLVVEGSREMYVEPMVALHSGGNTFLAGSPNYLYAPRTSAERPDFVRDSVFGVIVGGDGRARIVPAPIDPTRIASLHGAVLPNGRWAVVFAQVKHPWVGGVPDTIVGLWHGIHDGRTWTTLERLPSPGDGTFLKAGASDLIVRGDTSFFAARIETSDGSHHVALFERRQGRWMLDVLPARSAAWVQLGYNDTAGLVIAIVRPDFSLPSDANSLFVHPRSATWATATRIARGGPERVYAPLFTPSSRGPVLSWWVQTRTERRARTVGPDLRRDASVVTLDTAIARVVALSDGRGSPLWITEHVGAPGASELRFHVVAPDAALLIGSVPNPFTGYFAATAVSPGNVLVTGPLLRRGDPVPTLVTLLVRFRVDCASGAPRPDGWTLARRVYVHPSRGGLDDSSFAIARALRLRDDHDGLRERPGPDRPRLR